MRDRRLDRYTDFVAFPGLSLGIVAILLDGLLGDPIKFDRTERLLKADENSFAQFVRPDQDPILSFDAWNDCAIVVSKQQVDPPCE